MFLSELTRASYVPGHLTDLPLPGTVIDVGRKRYVVDRVEPPENFENDHSSAVIHAYRIDYAAGDFYPTKTELFETTLGEKMEVVQAPTFNPFEFLKSGRDNEVNRLTKVIRDLKRTVEKHESELAIAKNPPSEYTNLYGQLIGFRPPAPDSEPEASQ